MNIAYHRIPIGRAAVFCILAAACCAYAPALRAQIPPAPDEGASRSVHVMIAWGASLAAGDFALTSGYSSRERMNAGYARDGLTVLAELQAPLGAVADWTFAAGLTWNPPTEYPEVRSDDGPYGQSWTESWTTVPLLTGLLLHAPVTDRVEVTLGGGFGAAVLLPQDGGFRGWPSSESHYDTGIDLALFVAVGIRFAGRIAFELRHVNAGEPETHGTYVQYNLSYAMSRALPISYTFVLVGVLL